MEMLNRLAPVWLALVVAGALNWACVALFDTNVLAEVLGTGTILDVAYVVVGFAGLMLVPKLMDEMHFGHHAHPRGA